MKFFNAILFIAVSFYSAFSQSVPDNGAQIKVYDSYQPSKGASFGQKNKISFNPLGLLIGDYPLYYERMFGNTFSVEIGVGVTYENYAGNLFRYGVLDNSADGFTRSYTLGNTYSISPKVYFEDDEFEGSYLAFCYRHRMYKSDATEYAGTAFASPIKESAKLNSFTFNYGYVFTLGKGFILDYYLGLGLRFADIAEAQEIETSSNTYPYSTTTTYEAVHEKKVSPTGVMGFKLGYTF